MVSSREVRPATGQSALAADVFAAWLLFASFSLAVFVTYARTEPVELYNVSRSGLAGGAGRALVCLGYPVSLGAIAVIGVVYAGMPAVGGPHHRAARGALALAGVMLCGTAAWPGIIDQADLDARPLNALAGIGVACGLALTLWAAKVRGLGRPAPRGGLDGPRVVLASVLGVLAIPWFAAELGFTLEGVPVLRDVFLVHDMRPQPGGSAAGLAGHPGDHHGMDGVLLVLVVLVLSRALPRLRPSWLRGVLTFYLSLGFVYGLANATQDWWLEQVVKRGWASWEFPDVLQPSASPAWAALLAATLVVDAVSIRRLRHPARAAFGAPAGRDVGQGGRT